tara:strand:- start:326 stop:745 length:420 start_codon:yes stop_codon:yes gene_type:complete
MSTLKVTTIQTSAGGTVTLTKQHAPKHWVNYDAVNQTTDGSFNQSSLTEVNTGTFTSNYTNNLSGASDKCILNNTWNTANDGSSSISGASRGGVMASHGATANTTSSITYQTFYGSASNANGALYDFSSGYCATLGDLA